MCDSATVAGNKTIMKFEKCGEIFIAAAQRQFLTVCQLCQQMFMQNGEFQRHIRVVHWHELGIAQPLNGLENYTVEELMLSVDGENVDQEGSYLFELSDQQEEGDGGGVHVLELPVSEKLPQQQQQTFSQRKSPDAACDSTMDILQDIIDGLEKGKAKGARRQQYENETSTTESCGDVKQVDSAIASMEDVRRCGRDSLEPVTAIITALLDDTINDSFVEVMEQLFVPAEQPSMTAAVIDGVKATATQSQRKTLSPGVDLELSAEENKENTPPKLPLSGQVVILDGAAIAQRAAANNKRSDDSRRPMVHAHEQRNGVVGPLKRKSAPIKPEKTDHGPSSSKRNCSAETPPNSGDSVGATVDSGVGQMDTLSFNIGSNGGPHSKREVLARMQHIKKQIFRTLDKSGNACHVSEKHISAAADGDAYGTPKSAPAEPKPNDRPIITSVEILQHLERDASLPAFHSPNLQTAQRGLFTSTPAAAAEEAGQPQFGTLTLSHTEEATLQNSRKSQNTLESCASSLDLTSDNVDMDSIQVQDIVPAAEAVLGSSLLDDSSVSLASEPPCDLDASQVDLLNDTFGAAPEDVRLLHKVGLRIINMPQLEETLPLAKEGHIHARASTFAALLRKYDAIWRYKPQHAASSAIAEAAFAQLTAATNKALPKAQLSESDMKRIVNHLGVWYNAYYQRKLIDKRAIKKSHAYYLQAFAYLPKTSRYTLYCEHSGCVAQFRCDSAYRTHQLTSHHSQAQRPDPAARQMVGASGKQYDDHSVTHSEPIDKCTLCGRVFATATDWQCHAKMCHTTTAASDEQPVATQPPPPTV